MLIDSITNKQKLLKYFLKNTLFEGWNQKALENAFKDAEIDIKYLPFIFENGILDITDFFIREIDDEMLKKTKDIDFSQMKIRDRIKNLVKARLEINQKHHAQIKLLVAFYYKPKNIRHALTNAFKTADLMWKIAVDDATDFNYYSKRFILAKIYIRVLNSFAKDNSENYQKTLDLLDSEIEKVMKITSLKFKTKNYCDKFCSSLKNADQFKNQLFKSPKEFIKNLPFFRLYK